MAENSQEKTEKPTDRRRTEARKKGTVAKSVDLIGSTVFLAVLMALPTVVSGGFNGMMTGFRASMRYATEEPSTTNLSKAAVAFAQPVLPSLAMLMGVAMVLGLFGNVAQVGIHFSPEAMIPKFSKINPTSGLKRMFSKSSLFDGFKGMFKMFIFGLLTYGVIRAHWTELSMIWSLSPLGSLGVIGKVGRTILLRIGMVWLALAALDYFFQRKQTETQLKMTKEEVRQEMKDAESSPEVKAAMARRRRQLSRQKTAQNVKTADVIITNPTHFAVAIKYEAGKNHAPVVVAKGVDALALKIREIATEAKVPIVENRPLARALHKQCEVGDAVPRELFQSVAEVLAFVYRNVKRSRRK